MTYFLFNEKKSFYRLCMSKHQNRIAISTTECTIMFNIFFLLCKTKTNKFVYSRSWDFHAGRQGRYKYCMFWEWQYIAAARLTIILRVLNVHGTFSCTLLFRLYQSKISLFLFLFLFYPLQCCNFSFKTKAVTLDLKQNP